MSKQVLSAFEATRLFGIASDLMRRYPGREQDDFEEVTKLFEEEARACYVADDHGPFDPYLEECRAILENEWNGDMAEPDEFEKAVMDQADRFDQAAVNRQNFQVVKE